MPFVVCIVAVAHMRKDASHRSEIVTQMLLGEFAEVLQETKDFIQVKCLYDDYVGWCQRSQLTKADEVLETKRFINNPVEVIRLNNQSCYVSIATPAFDGNVMLGNFPVEYGNAQVVDATQQNFTKENIILQSHKYLNVPYLWGGKSLFGIDCSGYTQQVFKLFDKKLPRDAYQQAEIGEVVGFLQETVCGDLAFFDNEEGRITHVGIMLNESTIIHASGKVRIDTIDNVGIINSDTGERTHKLRIVKRYAN
jgi:hypothetical protein